MIRWLNFLLFLVVLMPFNQTKTFAQPFSFNEKTTGRDVIFGVAPFADSFLLIGVLSQDVSNSINLRVIDLTGKVLKRKVIGCQGKLIFGTKLTKVDDHYFVLFHTDYGKQGSYGGFGLLKLDSCLNHVGSVVFYAQSEDVFINDLKRVDSTRIALTFGGVSNNHGALFLLDHVGWQYQISQTVYRTFSPLIWMDHGSYYITGAHFATTDGVQFSKKLGVHKFNDNLQLSWYKSTHTDSSLVYDQINFIDTSEVPWKLWGTTTKNGRSFPSVYLMDSSGRIWDSIEVDCSPGAFLYYGNTVEQGTYSLMTMSIRANLSNEYVAINVYNKSLQRLGNELELFNPKGSTQVHQTYIRGVSTLYDSLFLVFGSSQHLGSKSVDAFCNCYTHNLDTCSFLSPPLSVNRPCIAALDSVSYLSLVPDTVIQIPDSIFTKDRFFESFILSVESSDQNNSCLLFPNPGNGQINLNLDALKPNNGEPLHLRIYSLSGQLLLEETSTNGTFTSQKLHQLPMGTYFSQVLDAHNQQICSGKYVKTY